MLPAGESGISSRYPSPGQEDDGEADSAESAQQQKPAAKRKRENRYKNAPPAVLSVRPPMELLFCARPPPFHPLTLP